MFYRIVWLLVILTTILAIFTSLATIMVTQGIFFLVHIVLFIPGGLVTILHWMFTGKGFWGNNKFLTFIFALIPALISGLISYLALTGQLTL